MKQTRTIAATAAVAAVAGMGLWVSAATAEPPVPQVPAHRHFLENPGTGEMIPVGPNSCEDGQSIQFDNFHNNLHVGVPGNEKLGMIVPRPCSFQG